MAGSNAGTRRSWKRIDGVLLLDKPSGVSSNAAMQKARRLFSAAKAGHTGTLDPQATGLLPLCFGEATKFSADLLEADKIYEADLLFGVTTDTGDAEGTVLRTSPANFDQTALEEALAGFRGRISQIPPMHSALKRDGQPLYKLARQGIEVERKPREVTIHELHLQTFSGERCRIYVACSKGTYIRTLAEDLGGVLGCGAHLTALRRVAVGPLRIADAVTLEQLETIPENERNSALLPPDTLLQSLPEIRLADDETRRFLHGNPVRVQEISSLRSGEFRVYGEGRLLGLGYLEEDLLKPRRLVSV